MTAKTSKTATGSKAQSSAFARGSKGGKKGRRTAPVKVGRDRNWGPIIMFSVVGVLAAVIIGYAFWAQRDQASGGGWEEQAAAIEGIVNYREQNPDILTEGGGFRQHDDTGATLSYETTPPAYGGHSGIWQNCNGMAYGAEIANEHAVHSLEHGAVWITYNPETLPAAQVETLAAKVTGNDKMMMSPFPGLDSPISLQAWGYQLKVNDASDPRIDEFIRTLRVNASLEGPAALCDGPNSTTATGSTPQVAPGG
jgi:Protein of unknown function (DUF3105)